MYEAYIAKKWGFVPDYARLDIVYEHGGVYLDTDVEIVRNIDSLLSNEGFMGFESEAFVAGGLGFGAVKKHRLIFEMRRIYDDLKFIDENGKYDITPSPVYNTQVLVKYGLKQDNSFQSIEGVSVYPTEYFCPKDNFTEKIRVTENTYSVHHYAGSWVSVRSKLNHFIGKSIGGDLTKNIQDFKKMLRNICGKRKKFNGSKGI
jgi:hypothetical protein